MGIKTVPQPLYSPDRTPCDFWLFPQLRGCRYEMKEAVTKFNDTLTQEDFHGAFQKLFNSTTSALQLEEITSKGTRISCVYYQYKCPYEKRLENNWRHLVFIYFFIVSLEFISRYHVISLIMSDINNLNLVLSIPICWGVFPTDGLALMWHIPAKLSSAQSRRRYQEWTLIFMIVLSWGGVSPSYHLCMDYFLSIYFLSLISESCYYLNLPLTITLSNTNNYMVQVIYLFINGYLFTYGYMVQSY